MGRIWTRRAYEPPRRNDGYRVLVDRVWPRGVSKEELAIDEWRRDLSPSRQLRKWFDHDPERWEGFQRRYARELQKKSDAVRELVDRVERGRVTLVYGARDTDHNNAIALRAFLEQKMTEKKGSGRSRR
jgi:uncharacterized protein YeaO (DUF488 family)